ncbi:MAG: NADH-quinone oxidoreductase subunit NuoK [Fimbriimonadales bacterium]
MPNADRRRRGVNGVPLIAYLSLGLFMFTTGVVGVIIRRNPIVIFMCIELMLNSVNLTFLAFARYMPAKTLPPGGLHSATMSGQMIVIFVMAVAAAEVAVGLGIIMAIFRLRNNVDIDEMNLLRG